MKDHIKAYRDKLGAYLCEFMEKRPIMEGTAVSVNNMAEAYMTLGKLVKKMSYDDWFSHDDAKTWAEHMVNDDGSMGAHWTIEETSAVAQSVGVKFEHITDWCWWITMNMMYSDYCPVAMKYGVDSAEFYADLAQAFLFDKDGPAPECKLGAYYHGIVMMDK